MGWIRWSGALGLDSVRRWPIHRLAGRSTDGPIYHANGSRSREAAAGTGGKSTIRTRLPRAYQTGEQLCRAHTAACKGDEYSFNKLYINEPYSSPLAACVRVGDPRPKIIGGALDTDGRRTQPLDRILPSTPSKQTCLHLMVQLDDDLVQVFLAGRRLLRHYRLRRVAPSRADLAGGRGSPDQRRFSPNLGSSAPLSGLCVVRVLVSLALMSAEGALGFRIATAAGAREHYG